ncbi:MAG: MerR family transcriptional regulator [Burkholderia sp.]
MTSTVEKVVLPPMPAKHYFTIGEVSELCGVKPHVLRYWEQEFTQLRPIKRRGNRRYYQHHEVLLIRRIRELLYEQGFTINGARNWLDSHGSNRTMLTEQEELFPAAQAEASAAGQPVDVDQLRRALLDVIDVLDRK